MGGWTDAGVTGILLAQPLAFGSGELIKSRLFRLSYNVKPLINNRFI